VQVGSASLPLPEFAIASGAAAHSGFPPNRLTIHRKPSLCESFAAAQSPVSHFSPIINFPFSIVICKFL
jgi:hypothetical protein